MTWLRRIVRFLGILILLFLVAMPFFVRPLNDTPFAESPFYNAMMQRLDSFANTRENLDTTALLMAGWSRVNITPAYAVPTAGYGKRAGRLVNRVHDSLYANIIYLNQGKTKVAAISLDMLIVPPELTLLLKTRLAEAGILWNQVYISATHTHNSFGGWGQRYIGELFAGRYDSALVQQLATQIVTGIQEARRHASPTSAAYAWFNGADFVNNRVLKNSAGEDPVFSIIRFQKDSEDQMLLTSFAAHATTLSDTVMQLSRDYPGVLTDDIERQLPSAKAVFMAGAVGTMGPEENGATDFLQMEYLGHALANSTTALLDEIQIRQPPVLRMVTLPLPMREPQWRFANNWCFRHWLWRRLYGDYGMEVKAMRLGNILMIGMPCDFGGELMEPLRAYASAKGRHLVVTSFNGGYCGYITPGSRYYNDGYETKVMNWFGPGNGEYFSKIIMRLIDLM